MDSYNHLKVMFWNANSVISKIHDLFNLLIENDIQIALLSETFLKHNMTFSHADYKIYRLDRTSNVKGGVAILIRKDISHSLLPCFETSVIEAIGVSIDSLSGRITFISAYNPGSNNDVQAFINDVRKLTNINESFFICGDLNAKHRLWNCSRANAAGNLLFEELATGAFIIHNPPSPTHIPNDPNRLPSTIDIALSNGLHNVDYIYTSNGLTSDHQPVFMLIDTDSLISVPPHAIPDYSRADWSNFRSYVRNRIDLTNLDLSTVNYTYEIDNLLQNFELAVTEAQNMYIPKVTPHNYKLSLTPEIISLIRLRDNSRRQWQRNRRNPHLRYLYDSLARQVKTEIEIHRNQSWSKNLIEMNRNLNNRQRLWKFTKLLRNKQSFMPPLKKDNKILLTEQEKVQAIGDHFAAAHRLTLNNISTVEETVNSTVNIFFDNLLPVPNHQVNLITPRQVISFIKKSKCKKSPGNDRINNRVLKMLPKKAIVYMTFIFNCCNRLGYYPLAWKHASVIAIPKPNKNLSDPSSYRPISLLSSISKIFERLVLNRLNSHIEANNIIPAEQFGFRTGHSTVHQLCRVTRNIQLNLDNRTSTGMVLLDTEKAFDTVWHNGLIFKMIHLNFPAYLIQLCASFLSNRTFQLRLNKSVSEVYPIPAGVPQGSVISPVLYNLFTYDVPDFPHCKRYHFADDFALTSSAKRSRDIISHLNSALALYIAYSKKWKMKINANKTECIYFTRFTANRKLPNRCLIVDGTEIAWSNDVKYLGTIFDKRLTFQKNIQYIREKCEKLIRLLYSLINRRSKLSTTNKLLLYKTIFRPILSYACPVWKNCATTHKKKLQIIQNKCLKLIYDLPYHFATSELHEMTGIETLESFCDKLNENFYNKCLLSDFELIQELSI